MKQSVKILRFVTTFCVVLRVFPKTIFDLFFILLAVRFIRNKNNKYFGNNYGSSVRDLKVIVQTNKNQNIKTLFAKNMVKFDIGYIKYFTLQGKILTFE